MADPEVSGSSGGRAPTVAPGVGYALRHGGAGPSDRRRSQRRTAAERPHVMRIIYLGATLNK